jgi:hypothetical protein
LLRIIQRIIIRDIHHKNRPVLVVASKPITYDKVKEIVMTVNSVQRHQCQVCYLGHPPPSNEQLKNLHPVFVYEKPWTGEDGITTLRKFTLYVGPLGGNKNENPASAFVLENPDGERSCSKIRKATL